MTYRVMIAERGETGMGREIAEAPRTGPWSYNFALNQPGACSFSVPTWRADHDLLLPGAREVHVYKDDTLVWGGYLWTGVADQGGTVQFTAQGYFSRLKKRYLLVNKVYSAWDQLDIAWDLINYAQTYANGGMGITRGSAAASGIQRDNQGWWDFERNIIGALIENLAAARDQDETFGNYGGFDFEITPGKVWRTYYPQQGVAVPITFALGSNIAKWSYTEDGTQVSTAITGIGGTIAGIKFMSPSQTTERTATDFLHLYGLLQEAVSRLDIKDQKFLDAKTAEWARVRRKVIPRPSLTIIATEAVPVGSYHIGDIVTVDMRVPGDPDYLGPGSFGWVNTNGPQRIVAIDYQVSQEGQETPVLTFAEPLDVTP